MLHRGDDVSLDLSRSKMKSPSNGRNAWFPRRFGQPLSAFRRIPCPRKPGDSALPPASSRRKTQIHGSVPFSESFLHHHPWRIGRMRRIEIPDSSPEGSDGSAGGLVLPFRIPCLRKIHSVAKRGGAPPPAASRPRLESKMWRGRRLFLDRGGTPPRLTRRLGEELDSFVYSNIIMY